MRAPAAAVYVCGEGEGGVWTGARERYCAFVDSLQRGREMEINCEGWGERHDRGTCAQKKCSRCQKESESWYPRE